MAKSTLDPGFAPSLSARRAWHHGPSALGSVVADRHSSRRSRRRIEDSGPRRGAEESFGNACRRQRHRGIDQALTMLPGQQLLGTSCYRSRCCCRRSWHLPQRRCRSHRSRSRRATFRCAASVCAVLASNCSHGSTQVRALGVLIPCGGFFLFSMTVDIMQVRTARATVLA